MKYQALIAGFCLTASASAEQAPDLLRFTNGDQLRGRFIGLKEGPQVAWQNEDLAAPADFKTERIRQIVLRGGRPLKPLVSLSHLGLVNGDRFPGTVTAMDADTLTLETSYAGALRIPRDQVSILAANPLGGRIFYQGPFSEDEWSMVHPSFPEGLEAPEDDEEKKDEDAGEKPGEWVFSGTAWYWQNKKGGTALIREEGMPERSVLRFEVAWKTRLNIAIAFHADFARPKEEEKEEGKEQAKRHFNPMDASGMTRMFGNSYVLQLYSNYLTLLRTTVDEDGKPGFEREHRNSSTLRLGDSGQARVELRSNRRSGEISLFVNDEFVTQWNGMDIQNDQNENPDADDDGKARPPGKGTGFGFLVQGDESPTRISDIVVTEWNGMPDSARSLQVEDKDIVLMTNGTDRYAGRVSELDADGRIQFEGRHGRFHFPLEDIAEIRFARNNLAKPVEPPKGNLVVRFGPIGSVSGQGIAGDAESIELLSPVAGRIKVATESSTLIEFNSTNLVIDDWNTDF